MANQILSKTAREQLLKDWEEGFVAKLGRKPNWSERFLEKSKIFAEVGDYRAAIPNPPTPRPTVFDRITGLVTDEADRREIVQALAEDREPDPQLVQRHPRYAEFMKQMKRLADTDAATHSPSSAADPLFGVSRIKK